MKNIRTFYLKTFIFGGKIFNIFELACFRNGMKNCATLALQNVPSEGSIQNTQISRLF